MAEAKRKSVAELKAEYEALAKKCTHAAQAIPKLRLDMEKRVQSELNKVGLDLNALIAQKREAWTAYQTAEAAEPKPVLPPSPGPRPEPDEEEKDGDAEGTDPDADSGPSPAKVVLIKGK